MNRKEYEEKRAGLLNKAQELLNEGKIEEANLIIKEAETLDEEFEKSAKAKADLEALLGNPYPVNMQQLTDRTAEGLLMGRQAPQDIMKSGADGEADFASDIYKTAWAKTMQRKQLTAEEEKAFLMVNENYTHTTGNTAVVIPKTVTDGIWKEIGEMYPYWNDVRKTYVKGILTMVKGDTSSEAEWYEENKETESGKETFSTITLNGCELSRAITVSWKLQEMAMEDFLTYIQGRMAEKMGSALGYGVTHGRGTPGVEEGFKPEPMGVVTVLKKQSGTPQVVTYKKGELSYDDIVEARSKVKGGYASGMFLYANANTIWTEIAKVKDQNGRPIFISDPADGSGVGRIFGNTVKEDDSMKDGEILFSNPQIGYTANVNKDITMTTEQHVKKRETDYCGYAIVDGNVITEKAHALLEPGES